MAIQKVSTPKRQAYSKKPNYVYSVISVALVLFLMGLFGLLLSHARQLVQVYKESVNILVEVKIGSTAVEMEQLKKHIHTADYCKKGSLSFTSKEDAAESLREELGESFLKLGFQNPLFDMISFNLNAEAMQPDKLRSIKDELKEHPAVHDVFYQEDIIGDVEQNIQQAGWVLLTISILLLFVAFILIFNTIRLALFANRFLIKNMELVGASWGFISRPYLLRSILNGFLSGALAILGLVGMMAAGQNYFPELQELQNNEQLLILFAALILIGILITFGSTYIVVKKYLKMRVDDLY